MIDQLDVTLIGLIDRTKYYIFCVCVREQHNIRKLYWTDTINSIMYPVTIIVSIWFVISLLRFPVYFVPPLILYHTMISTKRLFEKWTVCDLFLITSNNGLYRDINLLFCRITITNTCCLWHPFKFQYIKKQTFNAITTYTQPGVISF